MVRYLGSITTAHVIVGMLQTEMTLSGVNVAVKVFDKGATQQGFTLFNGKYAQEYSITEDVNTNEILIIKSGSKDFQIEESEHRFDRDFDKAIAYLRKELLRSFSKED